MLSGRYKNRIFSVETRALFRVIRICEYKMRFLRLNVRRAPTAVEKCYTLDMNWIDFENKSVSKKGGDP
jgi:hypothetical protein